jgi:hypothetical protein
MARFTGSVHASGQTATGFQNCVIDLIAWMANTKQLRNNFTRRATQDQGNGLRGMSCIDFQGRYVMRFSLYAHLTFLFDSRKSWRGRSHVIFVAEQEWVVVVIPKKT